MTTKDTPDPSKPPLRLVHDADPGNKSDYPDDPVRELLPEEHQQLDAIWQMPEQVFQIAWVCAIVGLEACTGLRYESPQAILTAIRLIKNVRGHFYLLHVEHTPFNNPSHLAIRAWRLLYGKSEFVLRSRKSILDRFNVVCDLDCYDEDPLQEILGNFPLWMHVRNEAQMAIARSIRLVDPLIDHWTSDTQIVPIVRRILKMRNYDIYTAYGMYEIDAFLRTLSASSE